MHHQMLPYTCSGRSRRSFYLVWSLKRSSKTRLYIFFCNFQIWLPIFLIKAKGPKLLMDHKFITHFLLPKKIIITVKLLSSIKSRRRLGEKLRLQSQIGMSLNSLDRKREITTHYTYLIDQSELLLITWQRSYATSKHVLWIIQCKRNKIPPNLIFSIWKFMLFFIFVKWFLP